MRRGYPFKNTTAETILPGAVLEPVGTMSADGVMDVRKCTTDNTTAIFFNAVGRVLAGEYGQCHSPYPFANAAVGWAVPEGTLPTALQACGAKAGQWTLQSTQTGFQYFGGYSHGIANVMPVGGTGTGGTGGSFYAKITGRSGTRYALTRYEPNSSGVPTVVTDGVTHTTSVGYVQDIAGFADDGLIGLYAWVTPSTTVAGTWVMGPWVKYTERKVTGITCNVDNTVTLTYTDTVRYYIGG